MGNHIPLLPPYEAKGEAQLTDAAPFDMSVARDLRLHCSSVSPSHFVQEYREFYIDMLSAVLCAVLLGFVMRCLRRGRPLNCFERILIPVLSVLLFLNGAVYALAVWRADHGLRCSAHLLLALPFTKGFFWTNVALWDMIAVQAASGSLLSLSGNIGVVAGTVTFGAIVGIYLLLTVLYAGVPLGLSLWAYFTLLYFTLFAPLTFLGCLCRTCWAICCGGSKDDDKDADGGAASRRRIALFLGLFQVFTLFVALAGVHLSLIYWGGPGSSFRDSYVFVTKGWVGHFLPSVAELRNSWTWPSTGDSATAVVAGDDGDPTPKVGWTITVPLAASVSCVGLSVTANVMTSTGLTKALYRLMRKLLRCFCRAFKCAGKCCWCIACCACCKCPSGGDDSDGDDDDDDDNSKPWPTQHGDIEMAATARLPGGAGDNGVYEIGAGQLRLEEEPFAQGGGGQVFRGNYCGSVVCAKQLFSSKAGYEATKAEFDKEVSALHALSHPGVLSLFGTYTGTKGELYMVMEYCGGGDLAAYHVLGIFGNAEYARVVQELLAAVLYCHQRGMAHRDLKPDNVLLEAGSRRVKVADFGLAKSKKETMQSVTRGVGTPVYMAPECFDDKDDPEKTNMLALDAYAIGIILWQLWYKQVPFDGKSVMKIVKLVGSGKRPEPKMDGAPHNVVPPKPLSNLFSACWEEDAAKRPTLGSAANIFKKSVAAAVLTAPGGDIGDGTAKPVGPHGKKEAKAALTTKSAIAAKLKAFLKKAKLAKYERPLVQFGFADVESLCDNDILDDDTLDRIIGMNKDDVRRLRIAISQNATAFAQKPAAPPTATMIKGAATPGTGL